ncbi:hypothetical protein [Aeromicrobium massiliense]|uniref:hypothetical protein n=1 Tax=Aeromicrobium massiliense TaxID=1464554 RepID=UPI0002D958A3|nr:hypothetical protein [Aeromicrobium massiliense]
MSRDRDERLPLGLGYWVQAPLGAALAAGMFWAGSHAAAGWRPVLLLVGTVPALYAAYVVLMPVVALGAFRALEALSEDAKDPADGRSPARRPRQRRGLPPAPCGTHHWVDADESTRLVRRRLLVDDRGRVVHEDEHDRRRDVALGLGLAVTVALAVLSGRLESAAGGVFFALAVMLGCGLVAVVAVRVAGRVTVSRLGS